MSVKDIRVGGLDLSMTKTGLCHTVEGAACWHLLKPTVRQGTGDYRLKWIKDQALELLAGSDFVLIEGYLNHSHSAGITGMVHGAVRLGLIETGIPFATLPPSSLKKYATSRGGASKTEMALAAMKRAGHEFRDDNECDAWWLWVALNDHLDNQVFPLPQVQRESLIRINVEWRPN